MKGSRGNTRQVAKAAVILVVAAVALGLGVPRASGASLGPSRGRLRLLPGPDSSLSCTSAPCATVTPSQGGNSRITLTLGKESVESEQPETYYTDLLLVNNPTGSIVTVTAVTLEGISEARAGDIGGITVYFCVHQSDDPRQGCAWSFTTSGTTGGAVFRGVDALPPGGSAYIELSGFAGASAHPGDSMAFTIEVTAE